MVSINPTNNYQEPNLSINKSHKFIIWQWNEEIPMSNFYHICLIVALFFPSLSYTQSFSRQNNKDKAPWFHLIITSLLSPGWEGPHSSFTHLSSGLLPLPHFSSVFLIWSQVCWQQAFCSLYWQTFSPSFSITDSFPHPVPSISQQVLSTKHFLLPICFPHQIHALSLDWKSLGQGLSLG